MKKITLLLSIFSFIFSFGQDKTYTMAMDSLLYQVDKSPMATGILYDRVFSHHLSLQVIANQKVYVHLL